MSTLKLKENVTNLSGSKIAAIAGRLRNLQNSGYNIHNLAMGNPSHPIQDSTKQVVKEQIEQGISRYGPTAGKPDVKKTIAQNISKAYNRKFTDKNVAITAGSAMATTALQASMLGPGDKAMFMIPAYSSYFGIVKMLGADVALVKNSDKNGYKPDLRQIEKQFQENTYITKNGKVATKIRTVMINYPNNPTGAILTRLEAKELAETINRLFKEYHGDRGILLILDEVYRHIDFNDNNVSIYEFLSEDVKNNTAILFSASKDAALPGERLGGMVVDKRLAEQVVKVQGAAMLSPSVMMQYAYQAFLHDKMQGKVPNISEYYKEKSQYVAQRLNQIAQKAGWDVKPLAHNPQGGIFLFANLSSMRGQKVPLELVEILGTDIIRSDEDIANYFLNIAKLSDMHNSYDGVAVVPGSGFGMGKEECFVRICISGEFNKELKHDNMLKGAMDAMEKAVMLQLELAKTESHKIKPENFLQRNTPSIKSNL